MIDYRYLNVDISSLLKIIIKEKRMINCYHLNLDMMSLPKMITKGKIFIDF